ncbi:2-oxoglutarate and iron-dependent oxygenase domain-containing protein [Billgrantia endophytica]|uniref:2-oxoglutarate-dependent ethylene/succinate-forming enzyme n=1 Tax=Billgrantia endophytica TaxID=2033802 RepID=A0A2N7UE26_9GAMM|nr:2-oxoglutarate and iron-dependent oxygenase domain-containing protein [Halomonas endophytica]PMR78704.1 isopenicillin N synthase family oxygenase [Halomonas endophytica]
MDAFPKISLQKLSSSEMRLDELDILYSTCQNYGFFYLIDHGLSEKKIKDTIKASYDFFNLPKLVKERYNHSSQGVFPATSRGYTPLYGEILHPGEGNDPKEIFDVGIENDSSGRPFLGPTNLPDNEVAPNFSRFLLSLQSDIMDDVVPVLGKAFAEILGMDSDWFKRHFNSPTLLQRVIRYPPNNGAAGKHTDNGFFTLLLQEDLPSCSLKVWFKDHWVSVPSLPGSLIVNLGDMLQELSDDRFMSTPHQVEHNGGTDRISLPFFIYPDIDSRLSSPSGKRSFEVAEVMLSNFLSIWETNDGAGRAIELQ